MVRKKHIVIGLLNTLCQFVLLAVTTQAQLEEMNPESEADGPDGVVGKVPSVIHTALTCCCVPGIRACASTPNSPGRASDPNTTRSTTRGRGGAAFRQQMVGEFSCRKSTEYVQILCL